MDLTEREAAEIVAECIAAIGWQANFARNPKAPPGEWRG